MNHDIKIKNGRVLYEGREFAMTVQDLYKELGGLIQNGHGKDYICTAIDEEGNGYNLVSKGVITEGLYHVENHDFLPEGNFAEQIEEYGEEDFENQNKERVKAICIG